MRPHPTDDDADRDDLAWETTRPARPAAHGFGPLPWPVWECVAPVAAFGLLAPALPWLPSGVTPAAVAAASWAVTFVRPWWRLDLAAYRRREPAAILRTYALVAMAAAGLGFAMEAIIPMPDSGVLRYFWATGSMYGIVSAWRHRKDAPRLILRVAAACELPFAAALAFAAWRL
jgi:hypothetical protein